ncbi:MAG: hypothetical protein B7Y70_10435, partial [Rhizobiales bacterium 35-68-8]
MLYAILAYHAETEVESWSPQEDAALMEKLLAIHDRHVAAGTFGPAARLRAWPHAGQIGLMTHFADADGERGVDAQFAQCADHADVGKAARAAAG